MMPKLSVKLWHDDVRPAPDETWTWVKTNAAAEMVFKQHNVIECSLDHDLGAEPTGDMDPTEILHLRGRSQDGSGLDLVYWMIENDCVPPKVTIHSWNKAGADRMAKTLLEAGHTGVRVLPYMLSRSNAWAK